MSRPAAARLLAALAAVLRRRRLRWYVFGAQAVLAYGRPRMTADVDVTVWADDVATLLSDLQASGFRLRVAAVDEFIAQARVLPLVHQATSMPLDLVLAGPGLEEELLDRAQIIEIGGVAVPVISPEDLLALKVLAGRPKDLDDVRGILEERGDRLDLGRTRGVLADLEGALGQSDLQPLLARLVAETGGRPSHPRARPTTRPRPKKRS